MPDDIQTQDYTPNVAEPTPEEKALIEAGLETDTEGNPIDKAEAADGGDGGETNGGDGGGEGSGEGGGHDAGAQDPGGDAGDKDEAAAAAAAAAAPPQPAPAAVPAVPLPPKPEPPKDFDSELKALRAKYDNDEIDFDAYADARDALAMERADYTARLAAWEVQRDQVEAAAKAAAENAQQQFQQVANAWAEKHKAFLANPLRQKAVQDAIDAIDDGKMSPEELFAKVEAVVFDAFNWKPETAAAAPAGTVNREGVRKEALKGRQPDTSNVPATLSKVSGRAPDNIAGDYSDLDSKDIDELEDAINSMSPAELERYLAAAPGADARSSD